MFSFWNDTLRRYSYGKNIKKLWKPVPLVVGKSYYNEDFSNKIIALKQDSLRLEYDSVCPKKKMSSNLLYFRLAFSKGTLRSAQVSPHSLEGHRIFQKSEVQHSCLKHRCSVMNISIASFDAYQHWKEFKILFRLNTKMMLPFKLNFVVTVFFWNKVQVFKF